MPIAPVPKWQRKFVIFSIPVQWKMKINNRNQLTTNWENSVSVVAHMHWSSQVYKAGHYILQNTLSNKHSKHSWVTSNINDQNIHLILPRSLTCMIVNATQNNKKKNANWAKMLGSRWAKNTNKVSVDSICPGLCRSWTVATGDTNFPIFGTNHYPKEPEKPLVMLSCKFSREFNLHMILGSWIKAKRNASQITPVLR